MRFSATLKKIKHHKKLVLQFISNLKMFLRIHIIAEKLPYLKFLCIVQGTNKECTELHMSRQKKAKDE